MVRSVISGELMSAEEKIACFAMDIFGVAQCSGIEFG